MSGRTGGQMKRGMDRWGVDGWMGGYIAGVGQWCGKWVERWLDGLVGR